MEPTQILSRSAPSPPGHEMSLSSTSSSTSSPSSHEQPLDFSTSSHRSNSSVSSSPIQTTTSAMHHHLVVEPKAHKVSFLHLDTPSPSPENYIPSEHSVNIDQQQQQQQQQSTITGLASPHAPITSIHSIHQQSSPNSSAATAADNRRSFGSLGLSAGYPTAPIVQVADQANAHQNPHTSLPSPNSMAILQAILEARTHSHATPTSPQSAVLGQVLPNGPHGLELLSRMPNLNCAPAGVAATPYGATGAQPFPRSTTSPTHSIAMGAGQGQVSAATSAVTPHNYLNYFNPELDLVHHTQAHHHQTVVDSVNSLLHPSSFGVSPIPASHLSNGDNSNLAGQKRRAPGKTPEHKKDQAYLEKRAKNNLAAKRSRDAKRMKEEATAIEAAKLSLENAQLKSELYASKLELAKARLHIQSLTAGPQHPSTQPPQPADPLAKTSSSAFHIPGTLSRTTITAPESPLSPQIAGSGTQQQHHQLAQVIAEQVAAASAAASTAAAPTSTASHSPSTTTTPAIPSAGQMPTDPAILGFLLQFFIDNQAAKN